MGWDIEDVERDLRMTQGELGDCRAELARLREENDNVKRWFREAEGHRDYWKGREQKRTAALEAELARLREALEEIATLEPRHGWHADWEGLRLIARKALKATTK